MTDIVNATEGPFAPLGTAPHPDISRRLGEELLSCLDAFGIVRLKSEVQKVGVAGLVAAICTDTVARHHFSMALTNAVQFSTSHISLVRMLGSKLCQEGLEGKRGGG